MSVYGVVLFLHSLLRWAILLAVVVVLVRAWTGWRGGRPWASGDEAWGAAMTGLLDLQFVIGLVLYAVLSPLTRAFFTEPGAGMSNPVIRFFAMEHLLAMVIALAVAHVGRVMARKAASPGQRHRGTFVTALVLLIVLLVGTPWPFLAYGRPLLRGLV